MKADLEIQRRVASELEQRSCGEPLGITACVHDGVVKLTGFTCSFCEKYRVEDAIRHIAGVAGLVNEVEVRVTSAERLSDEEIRCSVLRALETEVPSVFDYLKVRVHDGEVTLEGSVGGPFLRGRAESAVRRLGHIAVVHNAITLQPEALMREVGQAIKTALHSTSWRGAGDLSVQTHGGEVTLCGHAPSGAECLLAEQAAWSVPGVTGVTNEIEASG